MINSVLTDEYKNHSIFHTLSEYIEFYDSLSLSVMKFLTVGTKVINYETGFISSIKSTLCSIKALLEIGTISDSFTLTRKYYDTIIINSYISLYIKNNFSLDNLFIEDVNNWIVGGENKNKNKNNKNKFLIIRRIHSYILNDKSLENINMFFKDKNSEFLYSDIKNDLNDYVHYNNFNYILTNNNDCYVKDRLSILDKLESYLIKIFIKHFIWIFSINEHYMVSDDYYDCISCNLQPPENSQYWVAPFIQEVFDNFIRKYNIELANEFLKNTGMDLR